MARPDVADEDAVEGVTLQAVLPAVLIGLFGGSLVGMTGIGAGSVIAALLLVSYPNVPPHVIVGSATLQAAIMKTAGVYARRRFRLRERGLGVAMAFGAIPCAIAGAYTSTRLDASMLRPIIAGALAVVGVVLVVQALRRERDGSGDTFGAVDGMEEAGPTGRPEPPEPPGVPDPDAAPPSERDPPRPQALGIGALVGYLAGLTSIGTGTLFVSALAGPLRVEAHRAVAAALLAGLLTLIVSAGTHTVLGNLDPLLAGVTAIGSVPGVIFGTALGRAIPAGALRGIIGAGILIAVGVSLSRLA